MKEKIKLVKVVKMEEVAIPAFSVFVGNSYVQHGGARWKREHCCSITYL